MMLRAVILGLAMVMAGLNVSPALAQSMTVATFLKTAEPIPRNPTSALRSDARRLIREVTRSVEQLKAEQASAQAAGLRPAHCIPPRGTGITPEALVERFETMPAARRQITVVDALRDWMVERYPCPG